MDYLLPSSDYDVCGICSQFSSSQIASCVFCILRKFTLMDKCLDFLVIGVQKSATTTLDKYLRLHPEIVMPKNKKELHYFDKVENFSKGEDFYQPFFINSDLEKKWGECTPIYCFWNGVIEKIYHYNPSMKLILILRNPIERAYSHWNMEFTHEREHRPFYSALINELEWRLSNPNEQHRVYSYLDRGRYVSQIENIKKYFNQRNIFILKMDELVSSPLESLNRIFDFLGVPTLKTFQPVRLYTGSYTKKMTDQERQFLYSYFMDDIFSLEQMLGWDCSDWRVL